MTPVVAVAGMGLTLPGYPNLKAWQARSASAPPVVDASAPLAAAAGALLDKHSRRRASDFTKALADAYGEALHMAQAKLGEGAQQIGLGAERVASVFGSALGEVGTMISLLDQMWREGGALSPMRFAGSVHNAAAGVVSIGTKNTGFTTSLGADHDTPAMALIEAIALVLSQDEPVMVACGDEGAPADLVGEVSGWDAACCALALVPSARAPRELPRLSLPVMTAASMPPPDLPPRLANNPQAGLLDLIEALSRGQRGRLRLDRGLGHGYTLEVSLPDDTSSALAARS